MQRVRSEQKRGAPPLNDFGPEKPAELQRGDRIETSRGLIEKKDAGPVQERETMDHSRRVRAHLAIQSACQSDPFRDAPDLTRYFRACLIVHHCKEFQVFPRAQAPVESVVASCVIAELGARACGISLDVAAAQR